eukprot:GHVR01074111.1.p1 GENE.GHVR01074111.1~~GHVR01074111.1.p1  ORF type:complete len:166 (+),score=28.39 GHVR01074111.1:12-509(+)
MEKSFRYIESHKYYRMRADKEVALCLLREAARTQAGSKPTEAEIDAVRQARLVTRTVTELMGLERVKPHLPQGLPSLMRFQNDTHVRSKIEDCVYPLGSVTFKSNQSDGTRGCVQAASLPPLLRSEGNYIDLQSMILRNEESIVDTEKIRLKSNPDHVQRRAKFN